MSTRPRPTPVILDCDTGTDDAVAIMMAALHPDLSLLGVTTVWGNHDVAATTDNTLRVLDHVGRADVPVLVGLGQPLRTRLVPLPPSPPGGAAHLPLPAAVSGPREQAADEWLVDTLHATTQRLTLVATGPLTNIAAVLRINPRVVDAVAEIVILGGTHAVGNVTPSADRNFWHDPAAAALVLSSGFERLVLITLDATYGVPFNSAQCAELGRLGTPAAMAAAAFIAERIRGYSRLGRMRVRQAAPVHDALTVAYLLDPGVISLRHLHVAVETAGSLTYGRSVLDLDGVTGQPPNAQVALDADGERFFAICRTALGGTAHGGAALGRTSRGGGTPG